MGRLVVVDHGAGNLPNVVRALSYIGADPFVSSDPIQIAQADRLVFPGVGAFGDCMEELRARDLLDALGEYRLKERPLLGICVGLQLLFEESEEFGPLKGLGWLNGKVRQLHPRPGFKCPIWGGAGCDGRRRG